MLVEVGEVWFGAFSARDPNRSGQSSDSIYFRKLAYFMLFRCSSLPFQFLLNFLLKKYLKKKVY